jgi:putative tryptophan/tyrosine transport system substrate-binding protein
MTKRRKLLVALGVSVLASPLTLHAQPQTKIWRVGFLAPRRPDDLATDVYSGFPRGMRDLGYIERKNLIIEWRYADGVLDRLPGLAAELVRLKVDVIVTAGTPATSAAQKATATIPIVMGSAADPVASGFVKSLARPGANITGLSTVVTDVSPKRLELLLNVVPTVSRVAVLVDPNDSSHAAIFKSLQAAAKKAGITVLAMEAKTPQEIETAFSLMVREKAGGLIVVGGGVFNQQEGQIAELAVKKRIPSISSRVEYAKVGGLMSYGDNRAESFRHVAMFVDKILKGAKPSELPVEQPTIFELLVNGKTAKALGLKFPQSILVSADKVIE